MPIDPNATAKDFSLIIYDKTEIDNYNISEKDRVNTVLSLKSDKVDEGSPSGIATLDQTGKVTRIELPISEDLQLDDYTNNDSLVTPRGLDYTLQTKNYISEVEGDLKYGDLKKDGSVEMDAGYVALNDKSIATKDMLLPEAPTADGNYKLNVSNGVVSWISV